ncbi:MAG: heavy metal translocating P-type ATPase metal-binding domain-containing protein [Flavobacteriales bacterium]|nr:heavy metal translocating P-type ATPase metal-binding domain-containing protein [Flavobacteriales bacterium]
MLETQVDSSQNVDTERLSCFHCGQKCEGQPVVWDEHAFCCQGCAVVYDLLTTHGLDTYYALGEKPGISMRQKPDNDQYAFLDIPEVVDALADFHDGKTLRLTFEIPAIHCASCVWLLENLHRLEPGIRQAQVQFLRKEVAFILDTEHITLRQLAERLHSLGYGPRIQLDATEKKRPLRNSGKDFLNRLGVAGFCFGNIMLLSFPEYFHLDAVAESSFRRFFGWLNLFLALPVLFYSSRDFFHSAFVALRHRVVNIDVPLALGIVVMFVRSAWEIISGTGAGFMDALAGLVFLLLVGRWFQNKSFETLSFERHFKSYFPLSVNVETPQGLKPVPLEGLKPGDVVVLKNQELIPADGVVEEGVGQIDYSFVTGETLPVQRVPGEKVFAGGRQTGGMLKVRLTKNISQSYLTALWNAPAFQNARPAFLSSRTHVVSRYFTLAQLLVAGLGAAIWLPVDAGRALHVFTSVLIITCPCALALTVPFAFGNSLRILSRRKFYLKNADVIESLARVDTVIFDKTGTLTKPDEKSVEYTGTPLTEQEQSLIRWACLTSTHPLSASLASHLEKIPIPEQGPPVQEIPGKGLSCGPLQLGSAEFLGQEARAADAFLDNSSAQVYVAFGEEVKGHFTIQSHFREGLPELSEHLTRMGQRLAVLSGDKDHEKPILQQILGAQVEMAFRQKPEDKMHFIQKLQKTGRCTLMLGDGLNDAGALRQADVGVALTEENGVFFPASDAMLRASALPQLPAFLKQARHTLLTVRLSFIISLFYNSVGLYFALTGTLRPVVAAVLMPVSSVTVMLFTVGTTFLFARKNKLL